MKKILITCFLILASFVIPRDIYAQTENSCQINVTARLGAPIGNQQYLIASPTITNVTIDGEIFSTNVADEVYFRVPESGVGLTILGGYIQNGTYVGGDVYRENQWEINKAPNFLFPDPNQQYTLQLFRNRGIGTPHTLICSAVVTYTPPAFQCSGNDLSNLNILIPPNWNRDLDNTIRILNAPSQMRSETLYLTIASTSQTGNNYNILNGRAVLIDENGNGETTINVNNLSPQSENGTYQVLVQDSVDRGNLCHPAIPIEVSGDYTCKRQGETCSTTDTTPPCGEQICICSDQNPQDCKIGLPPLITYNPVCINSSPPTCQECTYRGNVTENSVLVDCHPMVSSRPFDCSYVCKQQGTTLLQSCRINGQLGIRTAIGCVPIEKPEDTLGFFVKWTLGVVGGIAILLLIYGSFEIITSKGDKYKLQSGKDIILAAISGIFLAIFSLAFLRIVTDVFNLF